MSSLIVKIFLTKPHTTWQSHYTDIEDLFKENDLKVVMESKVLGQNSVVLVIDGEPDKLAAVFRHSDLQKAMVDAGQGYIETMIITE